MGGATSRSEYYLEDNQELVRRTASRRTGYGRWRLAGDRSKLVVAIERNDAGVTRVIPGPMYSRKREAEAMIREYGFRGSRSTPDIGRHLPTVVASEMQARVSSVVETVSARYRNLSNEERMTGALFGGLPDVIRIDGWSVRFYSQGYSSVGKDAKEGRVGADAGILIELVDGPESTMKALWLQAKRTLEYPNDVLVLPDLRKQMQTMRSYTDAAYALVFTPQGIFVTDGARRWPFAEWLVEAARCRHGDRDPEIIADTIDRHHVLDMTVARVRR